MSRLRAHPFLMRWIVASGLLLCVMLLWDIATPNPSGPDESAQLIKSAAIVRGTLIGTPKPGASKSSGTVLVSVPATFDSIRSHAPCDYGSPDKPTGCGPALVGSSKLIRIETYEGRYPPLYYAITGLPTLVTSTPSVVYAMRAMGALVVAVLLGMAFAALITWGRSRLVLVALAAVVTPTALYLGGVVNPSGMEIAGATAFWTTTLILVFYEYEDPPMSLVVAASVAAVALCASRPLSTAFYAFVIVAVTLLRPARARRLLAARRTKVALGGTFGFALLSGIYVLAARAYEVEGFPIAKRSEIDYVFAVLGRTDRYLQQMVGAFGSPNFALPVPLLMIWWILCSGLIIAGLVLAVRRDALVFAGITLFLGFLFPFGIIFSHVKTDGIIWQGRYSLPMIVGLPLLGMALVAERYPTVGVGAARRLATLAVPALTVGWIGGFYWVLRRYTVGLSTLHLDAFAQFPGSWAPMIPAVVVFALLVVVNLAWSAWLYLQCCSPPPLGGEGGPVGAGAHRRGAARVPVASGA